MEVSTIRDGFDRVVKKQKLSNSKSQEVIDHVGCEIRDALAKFHSVEDQAFNQKSILSDLKNKLNACGPHSMLEGVQKELNANIGKYMKLLEKYFNPDISKAYRNVDFDFHTVNKILVGHFYRQGLFEIGDCLVNEARNPEATELRSHFWEMHHIVEALRAKDIDPALKWVLAKREKLAVCGSNLELKLHRLQFMEILQRGTRVDALNYARTCLAPLASQKLDEFQKLMACLLWQDRLDSSPYAELTDPTHWAKFTKELTQQFCSLLGQPYESPLTVAVAAGSEGLPTLLKLANVMAAKKTEWQAMKHLPVPVELGKEFQFHSIFVCPVSRDQASEENPPMLLPCGHVLCKQSIMKLSKSSTRTFKCPYCPAEAAVTQCRQLYF
ncbi:protein RMD5 homolog [Punica granatum]|uniref:Uncharacterized protein n=2 Tax=Punica granatum TaxID=22663 RepID=A0A218VT07_PUNGR|nr:protein RMD5 homolog [Punica granatum]OWM63694.1 hypothetical protein CDL15_Pgr008237 [Punica granatum]PKI33721.1 hypothetical protein CRG98_045883 [Punica granatum]